MKRKFYFQLRLMDEIFFSRHHLPPILLFILTFLDKSFIILVRFPSKVKCKNWSSFFALSFFLQLFFSFSLYIYLLFYSSVYFHSFFSPPFLPYFLDAILFPLFFLFLLSSICLFPFYFLLCHCFVVFSFFSFLPFFISLLHFFIYFFLLSFFLLFSYSISFVLFHSFLFFFLPSCFDFHFYMLS